MKMTAPNAGNKALEQDYMLLRALMTKSSLEWIVVQTNPNCEDRAHASITATGAIAYLPKIPAIRKVKRSGKVIDVSGPMFPRYLFVGLDCNERGSCDQVRSCDGVEKILACSQEQAPHRVPLAEMLRILETACEAQVGKKPTTGQLFSVGSDILLVAGVGATLKGVVSKLRAGGQTLKVELKAFGRTTTAIVPADKVELR
ncbi:transcription termination/antitermination NusG family protein [Pseudovibrio sp. Tun.PSC04-5.I4]|uniref:transcription termination/antitermination protein NusG n=1 Tax=Pseudovibrio sp. Tun.PSC04-5.I4 TaxID=1798213 RepID=UPI00088F3667|nr:transcription termination/antitermination NusG family protein [Pseudovibrio sp. Tun.PSC04-5.I4]SDR10951.1 Transcription antitermination factor NusG [Pseudovibrio sp. Tun.PSC04-5.I4]SDR35005.1 Transcription antitermination factor NusG [Pseudovibrio sp. Tun.PSC04-5.I4]